jgi:hypothetical protein
MSGLELQGPWYPTQPSIYIPDEGSFGSACYNALVYR